MKRYRLLLLALAGSLLLWGAWPISPLTILIFIAWVPLLWVESLVSSWKKLFAITYLHMLCWNLLTTWWIWNASLAGALSAFLANSLIMCIPWLLFYLTKKKLGQWTGYGSLIIYWLSFEYLHHNWELSWPWLTLGNAFATHPEWVQWYEYSGTAGGSLWILLSNVLAYSIFAQYRSTGRSKKYYLTLISWALLLLLPMISSQVILHKQSKIENATLSAAKANVVVVQPNIDPYLEKFAGDVESQVHKLISLSEEKIDANTKLVIWPETAIPISAWEDGSIKQNRFYRPVWDFMQRHPQLDLLSGMNSARNYGTDKKNATASSRLDPNTREYYDEFNTAAFIHTDTTIDYYHKAKLVPGVETLPSFLGFMGSWFEDFGGISGTLGRDSERKVFTGKDGYYKVAPVICYESIYGDYITEYIRRGANLLTILTNDGWWGNTPGYRQHMNYARLRAIETRKWVARSANTGISCFIDPLGNIIEPQPWDIASAIQLNVPASNNMSFYVRHGDMLSPAACIVAAILFLSTIVVVVRKRLAKKK